jgi:ABC-type multidrug transport system ATPase subunit
MLSSHMLSEVETMVGRVIIIRRGFVGLARRLSELETEPVVVLEARGPVDQVTALLRNAEGVEEVRAEPLEDGLASYVIRTTGYKDLREALAARLAKNNIPLRRLDLRRKRLQDRWNEINNMDEGQLGTQGASDAITRWGGPVASGS